jgi:hypothetical protein
MSGLEEIEQAIDRLPPEDIERIAQWLRDREIRRRNEDLSDAYREMALDSERERDALEWSEGLIGDIVADRRDASR